MLLNFPMKMRRIWLLPTPSRATLNLIIAFAPICGAMLHYIAWAYCAYFLALLCLPAIAHAQYTANPSAGSGTSNESGIPATCSPAVQGLMNRAWMEAQRELEVGQMLLQQPTSVLSYGCF